MNVGFAILVVGVEVVGLQSDHVQLPVTNAAFRHLGIGKFADVRGQAFQNDRFQAVLVVKVAVQERHRQVVMIVLQTCKTFSEFAFVMVKDVAEIGNTMARRRVALAVALDRATDQIAHCLRAVAVAARGNQVIELSCQRVVQ